MQGQARSKGTRLDNTYVGDETAGSLCQMIAHEENGEALRSLISFVEPRDGEEAGRDEPRFKTSEEEASHIEGSCAW